MNKKLIAGLVVVTMATTAGFSFANGNGDRGGNGSRGEGNGMPKTLNFEYIYSQLDLTETAQADATEVIKAFAEAQKAKMDEQRSQMRESDTRPSREEMKVLREAQRAEATVALTDQLNTVLAPDQTAELVEYINAHSPKPDGMGRQGDHR